MDDTIDRELEGLRRPVESKHRIGNAILAMQAPERTKGWQSLKWPVGIGSAALAVAAVALFGTLTAEKAYAGELRAIESAQESQKTVYQKSVLFDKSEKPIVVMETWIDHEKEAFRQHSDDGSLRVARVSDGKRTYQYVSATPDGGMAASATYEDDLSPHFGINTLAELLQSKLFRDHKVEKKTGVLLDGHACDYYSVANGYYRLWVDPVTKLPVQREIYDRGVTLWKRDTYDYPASFPASTFKPYQPAGMTYRDYNAERKKLEEKYGHQSQTATVR